MRFSLWHRKFFYKRLTVPFSPDDVSEYAWEQHQNGASYGSLAFFMEAMNCAVHVLGMPTKDPHKPLVSTQETYSTSKQRPDLRQARRFTVAEVLYLEKVLGDPTVDINDRCACGALLFALYGRCTWSDLRRVSQCELDINPIDGRTIGQGFTTFFHETASQVARHGLPLPLIAPVWGLQGPPLAIEWKRVAEAVRLDFTDWTKGPILPAPDKAGTWCSRSTTTSEASKWLVEILQAGPGNPDGISSHSLKCTTLSWLAKAGSDPPPSCSWALFFAERIRGSTQSRHALSPTAHP